MDQNGKSCALHDEICRSLSHRQQLRRIQDRVSKQRHYHNLIFECQRSKGKKYVILVILNTFKISFKKN